MSNRPGLPEEAMNRPQNLAAGTANPHLKGIVLILISLALINASDVAAKLSISSPVSGSLFPLWISLFQQFSLAFQESFHLTGTFFHFPFLSSQCDFHSSYLFQYALYPGSCMSRWEFLFTQEFPTMTTP